MSHTELHTGSLKLLSQVCERDTLKLLIYTSQLKTDEDADKDDFIILHYVKGNPCFLWYKNKLFQFFNYENTDDLGYLNKITKFGDDISFNLIFYNGGTYFEEMLEEGLNKINF